MENINRKAVIKKAVEVFAAQNEGVKTSQAEMDRFVTAWEEAQFQLVESLQGEKQEDGTVKYPTVKTGVATFTKKETEAKVGRNPKDGSEIQIAGKIAPKVKLSSDMKKLTVEK